MFFYYLYFLKPNDMRYYLFILLIVLTSCYVRNAPNTSIGMTTEAFIKEAKNEELVILEDGYKVYKVKYGLNNHKAPKYYYFINDKLVKMDEGELPLKRYEISVN